jgi:hypothetical protein
MRPFTVGQPQHLCLEAGIYGTSPFTQLLQLSKLLNLDLESLQQLFICRQPMRGELRVVDWGSGDSDAMRGIVG